MRLFDSQRPIYIAVFGLLCATGCIDSWALPTTLQLEYGGRDTLDLTVGYIEETQVILAEDFESANRFEMASTSTAEVVRTEEAEWVFEGVGSGYVELSADAQVLIASTNEQQYDLSSTGPVWLEMNYRCSQQFAVGLAAANAVNSSRIPILVLNPTEGAWNKIYLDLGPVIRTTPDASHYEIILEAYYDYSQDVTTVAIDNFKLLRY